LKNSKDTDLTDRRTAAAGAKAALLTAYRAAKDAAGPEQATRQAERQAVAVARDQRRVEREQLKAEEQERVQADATERRAELDAAAKAEVEVRETADKNRIAWLIEDEAARKAERDRRYAARKARQS
jgi:hypothetical protein